MNTEIISLPYQELKLEEGGIREYDCNDAGIEVFTAAHVIESLCPGEQISRRYFDADSNLLAESFGFPGIHGLPPSCDFIIDCNTLVCNCMCGDGAQRVKVYLATKDGGIMVGHFDLEHFCREQQYERRLLAEVFNPQTGNFVITCYTGDTERETVWESSILDYEGFLFQKYAPSREYVEREMNAERIWVAMRNGEYDDND